MGSGRRRSPVTDRIEGDAAVADGGVVESDGPTRSVEPTATDRDLTGRARHLIVRHGGLVGWLLSVLGWGAWLTYTLRSRGDQVSLFGDEWWYWLTSSTIEDPFRLTGYVEQLRGISFPLVIRWISTGLGVVEPGPRGVAATITVICVPLLTAVIAPSLVRSLGVRTRVGVVRILVLNVLFFAFWRNDTLRLLTDIPSLTAFAGSVALLARLATARARGWAQLVLVGLAAGALLAVAANTRPAYLVAAGVAVVSIPLLRWGSSLKGTGAILAAVAVGLVLGFGPQLAVNRQQGAGWSVVPADSGRLAEFQLRVGLDMQRYDTYIGPPAEYPKNGMVYDNKANTETMDVKSVQSVPTYIWASLRAPIPAIETLVRHGFNGLDIRRSGTYVEDIHAATVPTQVANFSVLVVAAGVLGMRALRWARSRGTRSGSWVARRTPVRLWFVVVLGAVTAQALASAIETRFLLPLHLVLLAVVALTARADDLPRPVLGRIAAGVGAVALVVASLLFSSSVSRTLTPPVPEPKPTAAPASGSPAAGSTSG